MANGSTPGFLANPLPLIAIAMLAAGLVVRTIPLESGRIGDADRASPSTFDRQDVPARLWQDPFSAVNAVLPKPGTQPVFDSEHAPKRFFERQRERNAERAKNKEAPRPPIQILGVMMLTSAFAEDAESRRRTRYAVMSGLAAAHYRPRDPEGLGYIQIPSAQKGKLPALVPFEWFKRPPAENPSAQSGSSTERAHTDNSAKEDTTAVERPQDERVLVLWLEENALGREPVKQLYALLSLLCEREKKRPLCEAEGIAPQIKIIGPNTSAMLQALVRDMSDVETDKALKADEISLTFYSPLATSPQAPLRKLLTEPQKKKPGIAVAQPDVSSEGKAACLLTLSEIDKVNEKESSACRVRVVRTIGGDDLLATEITKELALRGVNGEGWNCNDRVVIIAERDTTYGQELAKQFRTALQKADACKDKPPGETAKLIWEFGYLRGLDGVVAGASTEKSNPSRAEANKRLDFDMLDAPTALRERAEGRGQFDYVRRLAAEIREREKGEKLVADTRDYMRLEGRPKVKAIGVLGNDVYDKLLILQALHGVFPYSMYFTTDLDARLLHPDQSSWSRNLIVASNFGFALAPRLQDGTPPFRNGYQTSSYFATLLALQPPVTIPESTDLNKWLVPQMYEIGRSQEIQLWNSENRPPPAIDPKRPCEEGDVACRIEKERVAKEATRSCQVSDVFACKTIHPVPQKRAHSEWLAIAAAGFGLALLWFSCLTLRNFGRRSPLLLLTVVLAVETVLIVGMSGWLRTGVEHIEEPFTWFEGVSLWPSQLFFFLAAVYSIYWIQRTGRSFCGIRNDIGTKFFALDHAPLTTMSEDLRRWWRRWCLVATDSAYARYLAAKEKDAAAVAPSGMEAWFTYTEHCRLQRYWWRPVGLASICFAFGVCLFLLGPQYLPFRGSTIWWINLLLYAVCSFSLLLLVFQIVYITQMTTSFIRWITRHDTNYPDRTLSHYAPRLGLSLAPQDAIPQPSADERRKRVLEPWIDFTLIVRLTQAVDQYIYPPFVALALFGLAQIRLFDDWHPSPWMLGVVLLVISFAVWSSRILRRAAEDARATILEKYEDCLLQNAGTGGNCGPCGPTDLIKTLIVRVRETREGAFLPFFQRPTPRAILIPFGGLGGISIFEYLLTRQL